MTLHVPVFAVRSLTGQFADKPTRGQSSRGLVNLWTCQLVEMFYFKFGVYNVIPLSVISDRLFFLFGTI